MTTENLQATTYFEQISNLLDGKKIRFVCRDQYDGPEDTGIEEIITIQSTPLTELLYTATIKGWQSINVITLDGKGDLSTCDSEKGSDLDKSMSFAELAPREQKTFCTLIKFLIDLSNNEAALVEIEQMKSLVRYE